jgi:hypothetical protein
MDNIVDRNILLKAAKFALYSLLAVCIIFLALKPSLKDLIRIQTDKERKIGNESLNQKLYLYNSRSPVDKLIVSDYVYLAFLPDLKKYFLEVHLPELKSSDPIFEDPKVGYILWTPYNINLPDFIETKVESGLYKEIFNYNGFRFIKIR